MWNMAFKIIVLFSFPTLQIISLFTSHHEICCFYVVLMFLWGSGRGEYCNITTWFISV